jgi:hypothetical protein
MRDLVEKALVDGIVRDVPAGARRGRSVTVNRAESPLAWLLARGLGTDRQAEAGERLRADHERTSLSPSVTMDWSRARVDGGGGDGMDATHAQLSAKRRFDAALAALGPGLSDIAWRTLCALEGLPAAEGALGWPARSGRVVLGLALDRLADHYRLP